MIGAERLCRVPGRVAIVGLVALALLGTAGCFAGGELTTRQILIDARRRRDLALPPTPTLTPTPIPPIPTATPTRTPNPGRTLAHVRRVWDGNTILVEGGFTVRYIGVNTPGAGMFRRPVEPFGREAAERNIELVEGQQVELEDDTVDVDSSGFMLRYVYLDGEMVNETLLREGLARLAPLGRNNRYGESLRLAESEARDQPVNIWTLPTPTATNTPLPTATRTPTASPLPAVTRGAAQPRPALIPTFTPRTVSLATPEPPAVEMPPTPPPLPFQSPLR
jgi:endonuclease YncB( thermonuclease family)